MWPSGRCGTTSSSCCAPLRWCSAAVEPDRRMSSLPELIAARDPDAVAGFYDARAGAVRSYCARLVAPGDLDRACVRAFALALAAIGPGSEPGGTLRAATRKAAAEHVRVDGVDSGRSGLLGRGRSERACQLMPQLLAARAGGELGAADLQRVD